MGGEHSDGISQFFFNERLLLATSCWILQWHLPNSDNKRTKEQTTGVLKVSSGVSPSHQVKPEYQRKRNKVGDGRHKIISLFLIIFPWLSKPHFKWLLSLRKKLIVKPFQLTNKQEISPSAHYSATVPRAFSPLK